MKSEYILLAFLSKEIIAFNKIIDQLQNLVSGKGSQPRSPQWINMNKIPMALNCLLHLSFTSSVKQTMLPITKDIG
ncbi:hypothetical protein FRX31_030880 [Thalictrum thalictroides]|uniref:Uncharacterized protein n=1 Tax=Thalictrum thalictroides TaxID=46969 RepID=A0A7J6V563_THATH|nr:hypothetical protein FRX31_030880 [Thalictrum thalictroides]